MLFSLLFNIAQLNIHKCYGILLGSTSEHQDQRWMGHRTPSFLCWFKSSPAWHYLQPAHLLTPGFSPIPSPSTSSSLDLRDFFWDIYPFAILSDTTILYYSQASADVFFGAVSVLVSAYWCHPTEGGNPIKDQGGNVFPQKVIKTGEGSRFPRIHNWHQREDMCVH